MDTLVKQIYLGKPWIYSRTNMIKKLINNLFGAKLKPAVIKEQKIKKTPKEIATERDEPYVEVLGMDIDKDNLGNGAFELDWNDKFVANLMRAGYQGKTDQDIVDNWFKAVCRNVIQENFEQEQADPEIRASNRRDLGDGRTEVS
jgi:hypothetical protein